jgi:multidrug efflux pump
VAQMGEQFPFITFSCTRDISADIATMFQVLGSDAIFGAMVVLVILAWSMGMRIGLLVITAIPVSSAVALVFLYFGGYAVSNMVIFSFIVALGMVVDGAIIVTDAIYRRLEAGESAKDAAKHGVSEVAIPVFAADLTTIAAFLPMLLVPGIMGDFMGLLPIVVSMALAGSLIVDHFLVPVLAQYWFRNFDVRKHSASGKRTQDRVELIWAPFYRAYNAALRWSLANRLVVLLSCGCLIAWAFAMLYFGFIGFIFFPPSDRGQFEISFEMPLGYSIEETSKAAEAVMEPLRELQERGEVVHFVTAIGSSSALAARLDTDPAMGPEFGKVMVELVPATQRSRHENEIIAELRKKIRPLPGMKYRIDQVEEGPPGGADVAVRLSGKDLEQLGRLGRELTDALARVPGAVETRLDYRPDNPELIVEPNPAVVGLFGMTEAAVARAVQTAILGDTTIQLSIDDEDVTVRLQADREHQKHIEHIARMTITSPSGRRATIGELAEIRRSSGLFSVNRRDRRRAVTVACDVDKQSDVIPNDVFARLRADLLPELGYQPVPGNRMAFLGLPNTPAEGTRAVFTGENEEQQKGFNSLLRSMIIAVVLIASILVIEFNSFRQAAIVMCTVPLSFVGVVFGMWWCDFEFSLSTFIGLVSLTGVVVNDAIVLVDFANEARRRGLPLEEALLEAGNKRARAVMLTMLTSVGGMLPTFYNILGGGEFWVPLTGAMIFGLTFSAMLTLLVIPVCYSLAYSWGARRKRGAITLAPSGNQHALPVELVGGRT